MCSNRASEDVTWELWQSGYACITLIKHFLRYNILVLNCSKNVTVSWLEHYYIPVHLEVHALTFEN